MFAARQSNDQSSSGQWNLSNEKYESVTWEPAAYGNTNIPESFFRVAFVSTVMFVTPGSNKKPEINACWRSRMVWWKATLNC